MYQRFPGPWKRCADAAGGNPDAGALLDHILLRFRTDDALVENDGLRWIAQAARCWRQEMPLPDRRFKRAVNDLRAAGLIEVKVMPVSDFSPTRVTHIRLTSLSENFMSAKAAAGPRSKRNSRLSHSDRADSSAPSASVESMTHDNKTLTYHSEQNSSELSLAPNGARDGQSRLQKMASRKDEEGDRSPTDDDDIATALHVGEVWRDAHREHRAELSCSPLFGAGHHFAKRIAQALGGNLDEVVHAVVKDWIGFRNYVLNVRGAKTCSADPDIAALAVHVDAARNWLRKKIELERAEEESKREWDDRRAEQEQRDRLWRRKEFEQLAKHLPEIEADLANAKSALVDRQDELSFGQRSELQNRITKAEGNLRLHDELRAEFSLLAALDVPPLAQARPPATLDDD